MIKNTSTFEKIHSELISRIESQTILEYELWPCARIYFELYPDEILHIDT